MNKAAIFIRHKTLPGKREEVRKVWERYMQPLIAQNKGHEAYFYCYDDTTLTRSVFISSILAVRRRKHF